LENKSDRRNVLKLCAVAVIGAMASVVGMQTIPKAKAEGETVVVGGEYTTATSRTRIEGSVGMAYHGIIEGDNTGSQGNGVYGESIKGSGIYGLSTDSFGVQGFSVNSIGIYGSVNSGSYGVYGDNLGSGRGIYGMSMYGDGVCGFNRHDGVGVQGFSEATPDSGPAGTGVRGVGSNIGVKGESANGIGVKAESSSGTALYVDGRAYAEGDVGDNGVIEGHHIGTTGEGKGVIGTSIDKFGMVGISTNWDAIRGRSLATSGNGVGVQGFAGDILESNGPYGTGLRGVGSRDGVRGNSRASSGNGVGVQGFGNVVEDDGPAGTGVRGVGSNIGVKAESDIGTALHVEGKNYFKSAQRGTIPTGVRDHGVTVSSGITIASDAMIFVTLMDNPSNIGVRYVKKESDFTFRIYLTGKSRNDMPFGYFIVN
jgi:hypothetical protein